jgi:hypothetical protein
MVTAMENRLLTILLIVSSMRVSATVGLLRV